MVIGNAHNNNNEEDRDRSTTTIQNEDDSSTIPFSSNSPSNPSSSSYSTILQQSELIVEVRTEPNTNTRLTDLSTSSNMKGTFAILMDRLQSTTTLWLIGYLLATVSTPLLINYIALNGGAPKGSFLTALPGSISMCLLIFLKPSAFSQGTIQWIPSISVGVLEALSQAVILSGLAMAGSVIYTVAYSSTTMYTAILAFLLLKKSLHLLQWLGVALVMVGLAVVSIGAEQDGSDVVAGFFMILCGSLTHAMTYIGSEYVLSFCDDPVEPELFSFINGVFGTLVNLVWQCFYTIPRYKTLLVDSIAAAHGDVKIIIICYILLIFIGALHQLCFLNVIVRIGSTSTGLCKGVSSTLVFIFGHAFFCHIQSSQCFTWSKGLSLCIVIAGVTLYAMNSSHRKNKSDAALPYDRLSDDSMRHGSFEMELGAMTVHSNFDEYSVSSPMKIDSAIALSE